MPPLFVDDLNRVLAATRPYWNDVRGERFFITGGTGFFGSWLLETFCFINDALDLGMSASVLTRDPARFAAKCLHLADRPDLLFLKGDVRSFAMPKGPFGYILHAANEVNAGRIEAEFRKNRETIIDGTSQVLELARLCGCRKLLFTSSGAIYGTQPSHLEKLSEEYSGGPDPLLSASAYGEAKRVAEHMCAAHAREFGYESKIARCFAFVGPHLPLDRHFAIGNFIRDAMSGGPIRVGGDGSPLRSYLYASDLVIWLWTILFQGVSGRAYNVGSDVAFSIADVARSVSDILGGEVVIAKPPYGGKASCYVPDISRAKAELGLRVDVGLSDAIRRTAQWHRNE